MESDDNAKAQVRSILGPTKDAEFLQSFVRVGIGEDDDEIPTPKASISKRAPQSADKIRELDLEDEKITAKDKKETVKPRKVRERKQKREKRRREEELYTDKDRAAAVVMGYKDIKQSLSLKDKAERSSALQLPEEADSGTLLALAQAEMMRKRYRTAILFVNKAIELAPEEKAAYVARSKCHLLLGEPRLALLDAEEALKLDPKDAKALLRKAEALYYCGEFEMSLVHYHRGLRTRPDLNDFRLGVQKAQRTEAQLKKCWENLKTRQKAALAKEKKEYMRKEDTPLHPRPSSLKEYPLHIDGTSIESTDLETKFMNDCNSLPADIDCKTTPLENNLTTSQSIIFKSESDPQLTAHPVIKMNLGTQPERDNCSRLRSPETDCSTRGYDKTEPAKNIRSKVISEEFTIRKNNYDRIQERGEQLHKLIVEENEWLVKAAKENYKRAEIERKIAEEVLRISIVKRKEAEMLLKNKLQE